MFGIAKRQARRVLGPIVRRYRSGETSLPPEHWGLAVDRDGNLTSGTINLPMLREQWGSPLHVVMADRLRDNASGFLALNEAGRTRAEVYYSYKTNPVPGVLQMLHGLGIGAEVISEYELWLARRLGVPANQIVFNGPAKTRQAIRAALAQDILLLNINHREEIDLVASVARELGMRPRVGIRVRGSSGWSGQFGIAIAGDDAISAIRQVHESGFLQMSALHCHVGGMLRSASQILHSVDEVLALADRAHSEIGVEMGILDFGGSLATPTVSGISDMNRRLSMALQAAVPTPSPDATVRIRDYVSSVVERVEAHYASKGRPKPRIFFEPGRALTGDTQILLASVVSLNTEKSEPAWAILDAGINLAEPARSEFHHILAASRMKDEHVVPYRLAGPICSPGDVLSWSTRLPQLRAGDALAIMDAGAYFVPFSTSFSFPRPAIVMVDGNEISLLRRAEQFEDLADLDSLEFFPAKTPTSGISRIGRF